MISSVEAYYACGVVILFAALAATVVLFVVIYCIISACYGHKHKQHKHVQHHRV